MKQRHKTIKDKIRQILLKEGSLCTHDLTESVNEDLKRKGVTNQQCGRTCAAMSDVVSFEEIIIRGAPKKHVIKVWELA